MVGRSPESRTKAAEADAAPKLYAAGILPLETVWASLGFTPEEVEDMRRMRVREAVDAQPQACPPLGLLRRSQPPLRLHK